jgi:hypothetical protein
MIQLTQATAAADENLKNIPTYLLLVPSTYQSLLAIAFVL